MAIERLKRYLETAIGAFAIYTIMDDGRALYDDSDGRHYEAVVDIDTLCLFCKRGKMSAAEQSEAISMMVA